MKKQKSGSKGTSRSVPRQRKHAHGQRRQGRALHVHIALHPLSVLALLCVGVLLTTFTLSALADSYVVTAIVPAPPLTQPAVITSPADGLQTSTEALTVSGTCPDNSYVNLQDNGGFAGSDTCTSGAFQISLDLSAGTNQLQAQDYNITNAPGPISSAITVMYTPAPPVQTTNTTSVPPANIATPAQLIVTRVDTSVPYILGKVSIISQKPTFSGVSPPGSRVVVLIQTNPSTICTTVASVQGYWSCAFSSTLAMGSYDVKVSATTVQGKALTFPHFMVQVSSGSIIGFAQTITPLHVTSAYSYAVHPIGETVSYVVHVSGGRTPYVFTITWGDDRTSTFVQQTPGDVTISHIYGWINSTTATKIAKLQVMSADGQSGTLQFSVQLRNPAYKSAIANATNRSGLWGLFEAIRPWLWLLWPGYIIVILLVFSFWLGEREELDRLREASAALTKHKRRHAAAHR